MPNNVINEVTIHGKPEEIDRLFSAVEGEDTIFDFNKIKPMPSELLEYTAPAQREKEETGEEFETRIDRFTENHGAADWYEWALNNWSTKWNAYHVSERVENTISFQTAWDTPMKLIAYLSLLFPEVVIQVRYADEDIGVNCGAYILENGVLSRTVTDAPYDFAANIWYGMDYSDLKDMWDAEEAELEAEFAAEEEEKELV